MGLKLGDASPALSNGFSQEAHEPLADGLLPGREPVFLKGMMPSSERGISRIVFEVGPGPVGVLTNGADVSPALKF